MQTEVKSYDEKIIDCFKAVCKRNEELEGEAGASPSEVTNEMHKRGWLSDMDTVIDIEELMRGLRNRGRL